MQRKVLTFAASKFKKGKNSDAATVEAIFDRMDERVESMNVSFTFKASK